MNKVNEYVIKLSKFIPEFLEYWEADEGGFNFGDESTIYGVFSDFSTLVIERLENKTLNNNEQLFLFIESVILLGGDEANAACTCFLENILNQIPGTVAPSDFVQYLGPQSREFCRGWDDFTGVKTDGV